MKWKCFWSLAVAGLLTGHWMEAAPAAAPAPAPELNPLVPLFQDPEWVRRFLNYDPGIEPRLSAEEQALYRSLEEKKLLADQPLQAAKELEAKITPTSSPLLSYTAGTLYFREGDLKSAIGHFRTAVEKQDRFLRAHKNLGLALVREGEFAEALPHLGKTVTLGGADGLTYGLMGFSLLNLERHSSAEVAYRQAVLLDPDNNEWKLGLIKCLIALGEYSPAVNLLNELIEKQPTKEAFWILQANVFIQLEQPQNAILNLEAVRRLGKATAANLNLLADLYLSQEARDLALSVYLEAMEKETSGDPGRAVRTAEILISRGAYEEARTLLRKAKETYGAEMTDERLTQLQKAEVKLAMGTGAGEEAIRTLEEILTRNPLDGEALLLAGDYYARNDQPEKAEFRYQNAAKIEEYRAQAWVKQAQLMVASRKYPEAIELLQRAQKLEPRDHVQRFLERVEVAAARSARS